MLLNGELIDRVEIGVEAKGPEVSLRGAGWSFGMCLGLCNADLVVQEEGLVLTARDRENEAPLYENRASLTEKGLERIGAAVDRLSGVALDPVYGCPDCADGGAFYLELTRDGVSTRHDMEFGRPPEIWPNCTAWRWVSLSLSRHVRRTRWSPSVMTAFRGKGSESEFLQPVLGHLPEWLNVGLNLQDKLGGGDASPINQPVWIAEAHLVIQELFFIEHFDRAIPFADDVEVEVDHLNPIITDPGRRRTDVDVEGVLVVCPVEDERPVGGGEVSAAPWDR